MYPSVSLLLFRRRQKFVGRNSKRSHADCCLQTLHNSFIFFFVGCFLRSPARPPASRTLCHSRSQPVPALTCIHQFRSPARSTWVGHQRLGVLTASLSLCGTGKQILVPSSEREEGLSASSARRTLSRRLVAETAASMVSARDWCRRALSAC